MAKTILGIDIGTDSLKLALVSGGRLKKTAVAAVPHHLVKEGRVVSPEAMSDLIRTAMKENGIRCRRAALVLANEAVFVRNVTMPQMTVEQLKLNLPFEFRDFITDELKNYVFDYAMISTPEEMAESARQNESGNGRGTMELLGAAVPLSLIEESTDYLRKAGLKLTKAAPSVAAFSALIEAREENRHASDGKEYCILDLGYNGIRMYFFKGACHRVTRVLEMGMRSLDEVIADLYNVDVFLAHTYLMTDYEGCLHREECRAAYRNIAVELMRAVNFYRFSNPESEIGGVWLGGGGAAIEELRAVIGETLDLPVHQASELLPAGMRTEQDSLLLQAIGIAIN